MEVGLYQIIVPSERPNAMVFVPPVFLEEYLLLESGFNILLEDGSFILKEKQSPTVESNFLTASNNNITTSDNNIFNIKK